MLLDYKKTDKFATMKLLFRIALISLAFITHSKQSLAQIAIGSWRDHLSYNKATNVTEAENRIYCVADGNLFYYDKSDGTSNRVSKVNGLSDVRINRINYDNKTKTLIIAYSNANIDLIQNGKVINVADIKRSNISGNKNINCILIGSDYVYLGCGFGIVVFDVTKKEIKDTYYLAAINQNVNDLLLYRDTFYAATDQGMYYASKSNPNLSNPNNWKKDPGLPLKTYNSLVVFNNKFIINKTGTPGKIYQRDVDSTIWSEYDNEVADRMGLRVFGNSLYIIYFYGVSVRDVNKNQINFLGGSFGYPNKFPFFAGPNDVIVDKDNIAWIADIRSGLVENDARFSFKYRSPSGPKSNYVYSMSFAENRLWVASGGVDDAWAGLNHNDGLSSFIDNEWFSKGSDFLNSDSSINFAKDILYVQENPQNSSKIYATAWGKGLVEYDLQSEKLVKIYNNSNSSLKFRVENPGVWVSGLDYDSEGNLWMVNAFTNTLLNVLKKDGTWQSFNTSINSEITARDASALLITQSNKKWVLLPRATNEPGILVFDDNGTLEYTLDDKVKKLNFEPGRGAITGSEVFSIAEDKNGEIWVGTDKGVCVFYSPDAVFSNENYDAQQIKIEQDGNIQYLLETEIITCITVDGANRKWVGTVNSGVYFMSSDGTQQLEHFTSENSPLFSNNITSLAINPEDGEVFIGTDLGIISYKSTATEGIESCEIYAYPNPIKSNYNGLVAIKGLTKDANVKITDVSGSLIYQTKALGGQAIWDGKNLKGERAASGVYLVFSTSTDGAESCSTKILVVN